MDPFAPPDIDGLTAANDVEGLIEVLGGWNLNALAPAARALGQIGDVRAVEPLVAALTRRSNAVGVGTWDLRKAAAAALTALYRSGRVDEAGRQRIVAQRELVAASHADRLDHHDDPAAYSNDCAHQDHHTHADQGIGTPFPF